MNNIMEYQRLLHNNTMTSIKNRAINQNDKDKEFGCHDNSNILHYFDNLSKPSINNREIYTMKSGIYNETVKSEKLDNLFCKLYHLKQIDANGCIMIKPPKLRRSSNIDQPFSITSLENKLSNFDSSITLLESTMNIEEKIVLYENRLNKLEEFIVCKNEKNLYNEN